MSTKSLTGIILAGGKSSRLGYPKYKAELNSKTLLDIAISKLEFICQEIIVVSKEPLKTSKKNVVEKDSRFHPLVGITEGLRASQNNANIILACDMPFVSSKLIGQLINTQADICLYRFKGRLEPLFGFYRKTCLEKINTQFDINSRLLDMLSKSNLEYIDIGDDCPDFFNINTKKDLIEAQKRARSNPELLSN